MIMLRQSTMHVGISLALFIFLFTGCNSGDGNPLAPGSPDGFLTGNSSNPSSSEIRTFADIPRDNCREMWGIYTAYINPETLDTEIVPVRAPQTHVNVQQFLKNPVHAHNFSISFDLDDTYVPEGIFAVNLSFTHPFPSAPKFRGFDVRIALLGNGTYISQYDASAVFGSPVPADNELRLLNPDGYIRWFNAQEFIKNPQGLMSYVNAGTNHSTTSTLNPFKYFSDDFIDPGTLELYLQDVDINPVMRGSFSASSTVVRRFNIKFPVVSGSPVYSFSYVVDASYVKPADDPPGYPIDNYATSANTQEAYKIVASDNGGSAYYENSSSNGGNLRFDLEIFDWQSGLSGNGVLGEIGSVIVESPTLLSGYSGMIDLTSDFESGAATDTVTSSVATVEILNVTPTSTGDQFLFITVTSTNPSDYSNPYGEPYPTGATLAAYFLWYPPISDTFVNSPPVVGQVAGPDPVNSDPGPWHYTAPISDLDVGQVLTATWSVVPTGSIASYTLSSNPDYSIDINWSGYLPEQDYDINVRVNDGFASVEGSLLTVSHVNTPPSVGAVSGLSPVTVANTNVNYSAVVSDPDLVQTLTPLWSIESGGVPNYVIPTANLDYSLDVNWSAYDVGTYEVDLQINDGFVLTTSSVPRQVQLLNTAPVLGAITGAVSVNELSNTLYTAGTLTDPDNNQIHAYTWSVVRTGQSPDFSFSTGSTNSYTVDWCDYTAGIYDLQVQVSDGIATANSPILTVTRGLSICTGTGTHVFNQTSSMANYSTYAYSVLPRLDLDFFNRGPQQGRGVVQAAGGQLWKFEVAPSGNISQVWTGMFGYYELPPGQVVLSLDTAPDLDDLDGFLDNRIITVMSGTPDIINVLDADTFMGNPVMDTLTDVTGADGIPCIAIDENNDIWALVRTGGNQLILRHWEYVLDDGTLPYSYTYLPIDSLNLNATIGWGADIFDMVVMYANDHLYVLEGGPGTASTKLGTIHEINLATSPPTYVQGVNNIFLNFLVFDFAPGVVQATGADITIDHMGSDTCDPEHCRIVVVGVYRSGSDFITQIARLNFDLTQINRTTGPLNLFYPCASISTNTLEADRFLVFPGTSQFATFDPPGDW